MSNTYKHKILSMYRNGTLDYWEDEAPLHIQRKWDRSSHIINKPLVNIIVSNMV